MALSFNVPTSPSAFYTVAIEQKVYRFTFRWQTRTTGTNAAGCWYFSVETSEGVSLCKSVKLVPNVKLLRNNLNHAPSGNIFVLKKTLDNNQIPGRSNVGPDKDFELVYFSEEELTQ